MAKQPAPQPSGWTNVQVYTAIVVVLILGGVGGYLLHTSSSDSSSSTSAPISSAPISPSAGMPGNPGQMLAAQAAPLEAKLKSNPRDVATLTELGNVYYDAGQWNQAITYYTRSLNESPKNPDVRTDMGIAYFYSGDADRAIKEFEQALQDDPRHVQTLFNLGIVKEQGKHDHKGAVAAWEQLLKIDPNYKDRARLDPMLAEAKAQIK